MIFTPLLVAGSCLIRPELLSDKRGFFARVWCQEEFALHGLETHVAQSSLSYNRRRGTVRGMHYQVAPAEEVKVVRCTTGSIYDVLLDLRPTSVTFQQWCSVEISAEDRSAVYVPRGVAHGFQSLTDHAEVLYQITPAFSALHYRGVRWDDPAFAITWPIRDGVTISDKDRSYPDFAP